MRSELRRLVVAQEQRRQELIDDLRELCTLLTRNKTNQSDTFYFDVFSVVLEYVSAKELQSVLEYSHTAISRWKNRESCPRLLFRPEIFKRMRRALVLKRGRVERRNT